MDYLTAREAADRWGVSLRWVHRLCADGRIEGVRRFGRNWMISKEAEKPADPRIKTEKYCKSKEGRDTDEHEKDKTK